MLDDLYRSHKMATVIQLNYQLPVYQLI